MADGIIIDTPKEHELVETVDRLEKKVDALKASLDAQMVLIRDIVKSAAKSTGK